MRSDDILRSDDLKSRFDYHYPKNQEVAEKHQAVREQCLFLASFIAGATPESREQHVAITKLEEVMMWANAAIARNQHVYSKGAR